MKDLKNTWWKYLSIGLILFSVLYGLFMAVPNLGILGNTIRNLFYHVPLWFAMIMLLLISCVNSVKYLSLFGKTKKIQKIGDNQITQEQMEVNNAKLFKYDLIAKECVNVGVFFGILGIITGMIWGKYTWGSFWVAADPKLNGAALGLLLYFAYMILRGSIENPDSKGRFAAVYNLFAFVLFNVFVNVLPRVLDSMHPGNGGNPGFNTYDTDNNLRWVFYAGAIGWIIFSYWMVNTRVKLKLIEKEYE